MADNFSKMARHVVFAVVLLMLVVVVFERSSVLAAKSASGELYLTVAYCPTLFSGAVAVVSVDPTSGSWKIVGNFSLPDTLFGCVANYDPTTTFDPSTQSVILQFTSSFGYALSINLPNASLGDQYTPTADLFDGFINSYVDSQHQLKGFTPTVTDSGYCSDGCFEFGSMALTPDAPYTNITNIPFKALLDDAHLVVPSSPLSSSNSSINSGEGGVVYVQGSYDLRPISERCDPQDDTTQCLLAVDTTTGALLASHPIPFTIYKYARSISSAATGESASSSSNVLAWIEGDDSLCQHPFNNFLFGEVDVSTGTLSPQSVVCIPQNITVDMDEWIASFSLNNQQMATSSGNAESGIVQLLVFDVKTAKPTINSDLQGLAQALGAAQNLVWVWSVDWI